MTIVVSLALFVFRIIAAAMFAAAMAAFAASLLVLIGAGAAEWDQSLPAFGLAVATAFGMGSAGLFLMMPSQAELTRPIREREDQPARAPTSFIVAGLGVAAVLFVPSVLAWAAERQALVRDLIGDRRDPLGFDLIPAALLLAAPVLSGLAIASFAVASILALVSASSLVTRVLTACAVQQGGLVGGLFVVERGFREIGRVVQQFVGTASDPAASAAVADWLSRFDATVGRFDIRLGALFAGYLLARAVSSASARSRVSVPDVDIMPVEVGPPPLPVAAPAPVASPGPPDFDYSTYSVRPRPTLFGPFSIWHSEYDITTIPALSRARFSYSWTTGRLRREPEGPDLVSVRASRAMPFFGQPSYVVAEARTGAPLGTLSPRGSVWEIRDPSGTLAADVVQLEEGAGRARYVAMADGRELCKFLWGFTGLTAASAELQIDFQPGADARFSRALAIVLGPILERRARWSSHWYSS